MQVLEEAFPQSAGPEEAMFLGGGRRRRRAWPGEEGRARVPWPGTDAEVEAVAHARVLAAAEPLRVACRVLGMAPASWSDASAAPSRAARVYSGAILVLVALVGAALFAYKIISMEKLQISWMADMMEMTFMTSASLGAVVRALTWGRSSIARVLTKLASVDASLPAPDPAAAAYAERCRIFVLVAGLYAAYFVDITADLLGWTTAQGESFFPFYGFYIFVAMYPAADLQFSVLVRMLAARFRRINALLQVYVPSAEELLHLRILHDRLCDGAEVLNNLFSFTLILSLAATFFNMMATLTVIPNAILLYTGKSQFPRVCLMVAMTMTGLLRLSLLILAVNAAREAATESERTSVLAQKAQLLLSVEAAGVDMQIGKKARAWAPAQAEEQLAHLEALAQAAQRRPVAFSAAGFCAVDRPLVVAVVGTLATYLLVSVQFDILGVQSRGP